MYLWCHKCNQFGTLLPLRGLFALFLTWTQVVCSFNWNPFMATLFFLFFYPAFTNLLPSLIHPVDALLLINCLLGECAAFSEAHVVRSEVQTLVETSGYLSYYCFSMASIFWPLTPEINEALFCTQLQLLRYLFSFFLAVWKKKNKRMSSLEIVRAARLTTTTTIFKRI